MKTIAEITENLRRLGYNVSKQWKKPGYTLSPHSYDSPNIEWKTGARNKNFCYTATEEIVYSKKQLVDVIDTMIQMDVFPHLRPIDGWV